MSDPAHSEKRTPDADRPADTDRSADADCPTDDDHFSGLEDGAGCTEIWEHLSERRAQADARPAENADD
ncbi:hypothetical protein [Haloprofundus halophilus]|uniref:hypothetical protein n=1 Tax=Haloprofundus halophilus TaxID=2283527 RepID=UPI000E43AECA|nr:hypothetical protein [Haloprofundus halophilus]